MQKKLDYAWLAKARDEAKQLQLKGIDIGQSSLSALEGQRREASDREVLALSQIFQVPMERLFQPPEE